MSKTAEPTEIMLMPGELFFGKNVPCLRTLLGSCVAITLWNPRMGIGGMCHFLLPSRTRPHNAPRDGKYGDEAIDMLVGAIKHAGSQPRDYEAHLYGGADTMPDLERAMRYVGESNIEMGWKLINEHSFQLKGVDVGGSIPRLVRMNLTNGHVEMSRCVSDR